ILNVTEDSFSDGALYLDQAKAHAHAMDMIQSGAVIIDIGAESTRPGSLPINEETELQRVIPLIKMIKTDNSGITLSIDTRKSKVAAAAVEAGAGIINDVSALRFDPGMTEVLVGNSQVKIVIMHAQGDPLTMQINPQYHDVLEDVYAFFAERISYCLSRGIAQERIILDVGIGFGKTLEHNLLLLANLHRFTALGCPLLLGASRKSFINHIHPSAPQDRLGGSLAATLWALQAEVDIIRVHDVAAHIQFFRTYMEIARHSILSEVLG
ncbi:MAG: dihydropteroate synthase, partial [Candidatus Cloacimonadaceae bacterium]|nr:dihydropteroate synthase [Candidatus Cloacimonadaceae bacterium]